MVSSCKKVIFVSCTCNYSIGSCLNSFLNYKCYNYVSIFSLFFAFRQLHTNNITCFPIGFSLQLSSGSGCELVPNNFSCVEDGLCNWLLLNATWNSTCLFPCLTITPPISPTQPPINLGPGIMPSPQPPTNLGPGIIPSPQPPTNLGPTIQQQLDDGFAIVINPIIVDGNLVIPFNSTLEILIHSYLNISGCIALNGSLVINVQGQDLSKTQTLKCITANCFSGSLQMVTITNTNHCQNITSIITLVAENSLAVVFNVGSICGFNYTSVIIGIVVGVVGLILLFVILIIAIPNWRHKFFPASQRKVDNSITLQ